MHVEITTNLKKKFKDKKTIKRYFGERADRIYLCLSVLEVADCLDDVPNIPPTRRHKMEGTKDCWALSISANWRIIIRALSGTIPEDITKVEIVDIIDYH